MDRTRAEELIMQAFGVRRSAIGEQTALRALMRRRLRHTPRHADFFALIERARSFLPEFSMSMEELDRMGNLEDVVQYLMRHYD